MAMAIMIAQELTRYTNAMQRYQSATLYKHTTITSRLMHASFCRRTMPSPDRDCPSTSYNSPSARARMLSSTTTGRRRTVSQASLQMSQHSGSMVGVIIVDHGSRKASSNQMLVEFGQLYGDLTGQEILEVAHMEIAAPSIQDAVDRCVARGASHLVIAPYFLSRGRHIQEDIPALVTAAAARHPGLSYVIAEPIGIDPLMVQLIRNRVASALEAAGGHANVSVGGILADAADAPDIAAAGASDVLMFGPK